MELFRDAKVAFDAHPRLRWVPARFVTAKRAIALVILLVWLGPVWAYIEPPFVTNPPAIEGQEFTVDVRWGRCDAVQSFSPLDREIERNGSTVTITLRAFMASGAGCIYPDGGSRLQVGPLPAGTYAVNVRLRLVDAPSVVLPGPSSTIAVQFAQGSAAAPIPALTLLGLAVLVCLLGSLGSNALRKA